MSVIHIGQPKAASSSLQRALWDNRKLLAESGVIYPETPERSHNPLVGEFLLRNRAGEGNPRFARELQRLAAQGAWESALRELAGAQTVILSSEFLINVPRGLVEQFVNEVGLEEPTVLLCVRQPSRSLASAYSQAAKTAQTLRFELWARSLLSRVLPDRGHVFYLDTEAVIAGWSSVGQVRTVMFDPQDPQGFESGVLDVLGIGDLLTPPFIGLKNAAPSAARVEAFQILLREGRPLDRRVLHEITDSDPLTDALPGRGGRFEFVPDVAALLDAAYPMLGPVNRKALAVLRDRLLSPTPMTTNGLSDEQWESAVSMCVADLRERLR